jgi:hypothetical protein
MAVVVPETATRGSHQGRVSGSKEGSMYTQNEMVAMPTRAPSTVGVCVDSVRGIDQCIYIENVWMDVVHVRKHTLCAPVIWLGVIALGTRLAIQPKTGSRVGSSTVTPAICNTLRRL